MGLLGAEAEAVAREGGGGGVIRSGMLPPRPGGAAPESPTASGVARDLAPALPFFSDSPMWSTQVCCVLPVLEMGDSSCWLEGKVQSCDWKN